MGRSKIESLLTSIVATHCWEIPASLCPPLPCPVPTAWWTQTTDSSLKRDLWSMREREEGVRSRGREAEGGSKGGRERRKKGRSERGREGGRGIQGMTGGSKAGREKG